MERVIAKSAEEAGAILERALAGLSNNATLTVADAAAKSGLSLQDAERGLMHLQSTLRGTLSVTEQGEILFRFPYGLTLPLTKRPWFQRAASSIKRFVVGAGKFVVRAWVSIVMIGYAAVFIALALALMFSGRDDRGGEGGGTALAVVIRVLFEALWWTFHPFSPVARRNVWDGSLTSNTASREYWETPQRGRKMRTRTIRRFGQLVTIEEPIVDDVPEEKVPFYEKVNRFVFGPEPAQKPSIEEQKARLVAQIRASAGRIGLLDVMRVTGLPREEADPLIARLLLDYDGDVSVTDDGAIVYSFPALRKTAGDVATAAPPPAWTKPKEAPPVTGNPIGANLLVGAVNAFNLVMSMVAMSVGLTIERLVHLIQTWNVPFPPPMPPVDGVPIAFGVIPLIFSLVLFALPALRALRQGAKKKEVAEENARAEVLKTVFQEMQDAAARGEPASVRETTLKRAWQQATGAPPDDKELAAAVTALGGDVDMDALAEGRGLYRFRDLEAEVNALQKERAEAKSEERELGEVVYRT